MAQKWKINDSARDMTRKYNDTAEELNSIIRTMLMINDGYVVTKPSEFSIEEDPEVAGDGA